MEVVEFEINRIEVLCSYCIDEGVEIVFLVEFYVYGVRLEFYGLMIGVYFFFLEDGGIFKIVLLV